MRKTILAVVICGVMGCTLACNTVSANTKDFFTVLSGKNGNNTISDYVDPETGVHYLVFFGYNGRGGITPRLNPDGSYMVDPQ